QDRGITALMVAAGMDRRSIDTRGKFTREEELVDAAKLLLDAAADPNLADERGRTALHGSASQGMNEMVKLLAARGADLHAADVSGRTPLDYALGTSSGGRGVADVHVETARLLESLAE